LPTNGEGPVTAVENALSAFSKELVDAALRVHSSDQLHGPPGNSVRTEFGRLDAVLESQDPQLRQH